MDPTPPRLSTRERDTLHAICTAFMPALPPEPGDDPELMSLDAEATALPAAIEGALAELEGERLAELRRLLRLFATPWLGLLLIASPRPFTAMDGTQRERLLLAMATSRVALLRQGFQALKRLANFLAYAVPGPQGANPTWRRIGYSPSPRPPARPKPLRVTTIGAPAVLAADACVIGSGAGGGVVAAALAASGRRVVVLEAGHGDQAADFDQLELSGLSRLYLDGGLAASRDLGISILAGAGLGGGTTVNWQTSLRLPDEVRAEWAERSGCPHFTDESFTRSLAAVEARLSVGTTESTVNPNNATLRDGCAAAGYRWQTLARNAAGCVADQCGYCVFGCRLGGKQSSAVTYLADAQAAGDAEIVVRCRAERILRQNGRVCGVAAVGTDAAGIEHPVTVHCPIAVVAAGGIHSPALLLRSGLALPALGRNLYLHPASSVAGLYPQPIEPWKGPPQSILCDEFARADGDYGFRLETAPAHPGLLALATPWLGARAHRHEMQVSAHKATWIVLVRDRRGGRVRLGRRGQPIVDYALDRRTHALLRRGTAAAARLHFAAGAREALTLHSRRHQLRAPEHGAEAAIDAFCRRLADAPLAGNWSPVFSAHQMGTCRMGASSRDAVCNENGEVFGVRGLYVCDASAFPASSGVNPMLTIMALAHHTAQRIARP